ncbi:MAG: AI-2E family transporter [Trueperaceae bacterium]|nr:AI-2E family transporter [Trueperaceae bacterium]
MNGERGRQAGAKADSGWARWQVGAGLLLFFALLKLTRPITLPVGVALVLLVLVRPVQRWLEHLLRTPRWLSPVLITSLLLGIGWLGWLSLRYAFTRVVALTPEYLGRLEQLNAQLATDLPTNTEQLRQMTSQLSGALLGALGGVGYSLGVLGVILALLVLILYEVDVLADNLERATPDGWWRGIERAWYRLSPALVRYVLVTTATSLLTGLLTSVWCGVFGVGLAFVWGLLAFVLNFFPTIGSVIAVVPPTLFAFVFEGAGVGLAMLIGLSLMQLVMGNLINPALLGSALRLPATVVLLAVVFWGWLWGLGGAIIGVPLTMALVFLGREFGGLEPYALLLAGPERQTLVSAEETPVEKSSAENTATEDAVTEDTEDT